MKNIEDMVERPLKAYFFLDCRDVNTQTPSNILSSLLVQLSTQSYPFLDSLLQLYNTHHKGAQKPSETVLTERFKARSVHQRPIYIILDGLDALGMPSREAILKLVKELTELHLENLRLCVISRPEIDIRNALEGLSPSRVVLDAEVGHKDDIIAFIKSVADRKALGWSAEDRQSAIETLSRRADGM
jgi:hypothetical protein